MHIEPFDLGLDNETYKYVAALLTKRTLFDLI